MSLRNMNIAPRALLGFALWAAKYSSDRSWNEFDVVFREPVTGLTEGSSVQYNGIAVGTVMSVPMMSVRRRRRPQPHGVMF